MTARKTNKKKLLTVAKEGNRLETLKRLRDEICDCIDQTVSVREIAPLTRQLVTVLEQIDELEGKSRPAGNANDTELTPIEVLFNKQSKHRNAAKG